MDVQLNREAATPLYQQIGEQLRSLIVEGKLQSGSRLPPIRTLARQLAVSKITVWQAYGALQDQGLAVSVVGRGTVVAPKIPKQTGVDFLSSLVQTGPLATFEAVSSAIGLRSLASAVPDPELFRMDEFLAECSMLRTASPWTFYHSPPSGATELHSVILTLLRHRGIEANETNLIVTAGGTHGRFLVSTCMAERGDAVMVAEPGFLNAPQLFEEAGLRPFSVRSCGGGLDFDHLEEVAREQRPRLLFVAPTFGSVGGTVMPEADRMRLVEMAHQLDFLIVEDDSYLWLDYVGRQVKPISSYDNGERVVSVDSFSYCLSPGLRTGYLRVPLPYRERMLRRLRCEWMSGPQFVQVALAKFIRHGRFEAHLRRVLPKYRARRDAMGAALRLSFGRDCEWVEPRGGLSYWVRLPDGLDVQKLYLDALGQGVAFGPGELISLAPDAAQHIRLSFGTQSPEAIRGAVQRLGELVATAPRS